ncbi:hypothetical protein LPUS_04820 [Lasallia pustulata]|uniref:Uncharacterized protein n=1 Tax=Lasallia pustulata TaxID=136370 RepID=A0A1W5CXC9_9LECA|nr:hypothetical protein LPUS_04820 [Lasallia pustulata]
MMLLPTMPRLESRQAGASNNTAGPESKGSGSVNSSVIISLVVISSVLLLISATFIFLRNFRRLHPNPKFIPTPYLKRVWRSWNPSSKYGRLFGGNSYTPYNRPSSSLAHRDTSYSNIPPSTATGLSTEIAASTTSNAIDRNTSVRSIMTLPPYYPTPRPSERLIAREGERAGVDTVIEFPETAEEEESRRDEEMESLYQIRAARRREIEEREERRRQRREAREAGDWARSEAPDTPRTSTHGDRSGSDAARTPSASQDSPPQGSVFREPNIPPFEPPSYDEEAAVPGEEAPPYESPVRARGGAPQLPVLRLLPAIEVTGSTPGNSVPVTPVDGRGDEGRTRR